MLKLLHASAFVVERHGVRVDVAVLRVAHDEVRGTLVASHGESKRRQRGEGVHGHCQRDNAVEVAELSGLLAEQRMNAPTLVEPNIDAGNGGL